jgi:hypothetical protein
VKNQLVLLPPTQRNASRMSRLFVVSGRGAVDSHHYTYTFRPFFQQHHEVLSKRFPHGLELVPHVEGDTSVNDEDWLLWWQPKIPEKNLIDSALPLFRKDQRIIFHYENPIAYHFRRWVVREGYHDSFGKIFCSAAILADGAKTFWTPIWNYLLDFISEEPAHRLTHEISPARKLLAINPIRTGLDVSRARLEIIDRFVHALDDCHFYGSADILNHPMARRWQHRYAGEIPYLPGNQCYLGKIPIFEQHRFVLVIENTFCDWYISEKLAEPLAALTVPVYFGNPRVSEYMPKLFAHGVINGHAFKDLQELISFIRGMSEAEYIRRVESIREHREEYFRLTSFRGICDYILARAFDVPEIFFKSCYQPWNEMFAARNKQPAVSDARNRLLKLITDADDSTFSSEIQDLLTTSSSRP